MAVILEVNNLTKAFSGVLVVDGVDLTVKEREILGVIGPNGSGKTTLYNMITGFLRPTGGKIVYKGEDITNEPIHVRAKKGIVRTFQDGGLFTTSTVQANAITGCYLRSGIGSLWSIIPTPGNRKKQKEAEAKAIEVLKFTGLFGQEDKLAENLSHGYQKSCNLATVLGADPDLLILDEPVTALNPERVAFITDLILKIRENGTTIMITEHNMKAIYPICDRMVVLNAGKKIAEGKAEEIQKNPEVTSVYLGRKDVI